MIKHVKKTLSLVFLGLSYGFLSYYYFGGWWNSSAGTLLILIFSYLAWGGDFLHKTGLAIDVRTVCKSMFLAIVVFFGSLLVMRFIAAKFGIQIRMTNWRNYYHDIFYTLNEEIVLGALILFFLTGKAGLKPVVASVILAICFAFIHYVFYRWIFNDRGVIGTLTLVTLFMVGFIRNTLILRTGHIGYSWALHFGWMAVMFGSMHVDPVSDRMLSEPLRFNMYLGSAAMLVITAIIAALLMFIQVKGRQLEA